MGHWSWIRGKAGTAIRIPQISKWMVVWTGVLSYPADLGKEAVKPISLFKNELVCWGFGHALGKW
jgi:hypothetical protein